MTHETVPLQKRIYLTLAPGPHGTALVKFSYMPPAVGEAMVALISRGVLMNGEALQVPLVSDPTAIDALRGPPGLSAYQVAQAVGYGGTAAQWLATLVGAAGASAYEVAKAGGFVGTQAQWLASLKGADATPAQTAAAVDSYMAAHPVTTLVGTATLAVTATAAIALGVHDYTVPLVGLAVGDALHLTPTAALPSGWAIHGAVVLTAGTMRVTVTTPLLALNASVSIGLKVRRLNI